jgi:hypothetical protein
VLEPAPPIEVAGDLVGKGFDRHVSPPRLALARILAAWR